MATEAAVIFVSKINFIVHCTAMLTRHGIWVVSRVIL